MKILITIVCTIFFTAGYGQYEISLNDEGSIVFSEVVEVSGKNSEELYKLTEKWLVYTFNNPDYVKLAKIENEFFRGNGMSKNVVLDDAVNHRWLNLYYKFEVRIKDEKIKFDLYDIKQGSIESESYHVANVMYKDGKFRKNRESALRTKEGVESVAEGLLTDFRRYISDPASENDW